jgi:hypothetical protein
MATTPTGLVVCLSWLRRCPASADPWRDGWIACACRGGRRRRQTAQALARDSVTLSRRILATSLYLTDDTDGALDAWNRVGEPIIDLVNITGLDRTRYSVAARDGAGAGRVTRGNLTRHGGELQAPSAQAARIAMRPGENGRARVDAAVIERPLFPRSAVALGAIGLRALSDREAVVTIASPSGSGETWSASWRWWERRPKVALDFESPAPFGGVWGVSFFDERQSYGVTGGVWKSPPPGGFMSVSTLSGFRWKATWRWIVSTIRMSPPGRAIAASGSLQRRVLDDRAFVEARAGWRSTGELDVRSWRRMEIDHAQRGGRPDCARRRRVGAGRPSRSGRVQARPADDCSRASVD